MLVSSATSLFSGLPEAREAFNAARFEASSASRSVSARLLLRVRTMDQVCKAILTRDSHVARELVFGSLYLGEKRGCEAKIELGVERRLCLDASNREPQKIGARFGSYLIA